MNEDPNIILEELLEEISEIDAYLDTLVFRKKVENTETEMTVHYLKLDRNGLPDLMGLSRFLARKIVYYCIPKSTIDKAYLKDQQLRRPQSAPSQHKLEQEAKHLFQKYSKTGEPGELLMSLLIESNLRAPMVLNKMILKTSTQQPVHGYDGVHMKANENGEFTVIWGESKAYDNLADAITNSLNGINKFFDVKTFHQENEHEIQLLRTHLDLGLAANDLATLIKSLLDYDHPQNKELLRFEGVCSISFDYGCYDIEPEYTKIQERSKKIEIAIKEKSKEWEDQIKLKVNAVGYLNKVVLHIFLLPVSSVQQFRDYFRENIGHILKPLLAT